MDGKTRVCGLIANPVEHSMSPMMHNFFAQRTGVNLAYVPFKVEEDRVGDAVKVQSQGIPPPRQLRPAVCWRWLSIWKAGRRHIMGIWPGVW